MVMKKIKPYQQDMAILQALVKREIKARYKKTLMGFLWMFLTPLFQMMVIGLVFSYFIKIPNYFIFLFPGLLAWQFFANSLGKATSCFVFERNLLRKARFSRWILPSAIVLADFFHMLISWGIFIGVVKLFKLVAYEMSLIKIGLGLIWLLGLTLGISWLTASLQVKYRDVKFMLKALLQLWFYATPILYSLSLIPGRLKQLFYLNPLSSIFGLLHQSAIGEGVIEIKMLIINLVVGVVIVAIGVWAYRKTNKNFIDWL